eukprot:scaffold75994_cov96-Phaeocystis_antarctica.AAC.1
MRYTSTARVAQVRSQGVLLGYLGYVSAYIMASHTTHMILSAEHALKCNGGAQLLLVHMSPHRYSGTSAAKRSATASARMVSRKCASMAIHVSAAASRSRRARSLGATSTGVS